VHFALGEIYSQYRFLRRFGLEWTTRFLVRQAIVTTVGLTDKRGRAIYHVCARSSTPHKHYR